MLELSVVIPTYNRLDTLQHVIPSLLEQSTPRDAYELLICDSNSNDGTAEYLAQVSAEHPNVRHLPGAYTGRAMARNAGIAHAQGEVVLFNDSDIIAPSNRLPSSVGKCKSIPSPTTSTSASAPTSAGRCTRRRASG